MKEEGKKLLLSAAVYRKQIAVLQVGETDEHFQDHGQQRRLASIYFFQILKGGNSQIGVLNKGFVGQK